MTSPDRNDVAAHTPASADPRHVPYRHHAHAGHAHAASFHRHLAHATPPITPEVKAAVQAAMTKEGVPGTWEQGLHFIIGHESGSRVGVANTTDSARGLFQLTRASYHLNPQGAQSFGNAVEESQGGIRYIQSRYQTADNAVTFWRRHGWY